MKREKRKKSKEEKWREKKEWLTQSIAKRQGPQRPSEPNKVKQ